MHLLVTVLVIACYTFVMSLAYIGTSPLLYAQVQSNYTSSVCNPDGTCMTTICINDEPCKTIKSNSTMSAGKRDNFSNDNGSETIPLDELPQHII